MFGILINKYGTMETDGRRVRQNTPPSPPAWVNTLTPVKRENGHRIARKAEIKSAINKES